MKAVVAMMAVAVLLAVAADAPAADVLSDSQLASMGGGQFTFACHAIDCADAECWFDDQEDLCYRRQVKVTLACLSGPYPVCTLSGFQVNDCYREGSKTAESEQDCTDMCGDEDFDWGPWAGGRFTVCTAGMGGGPGPL